MGGRQGCYYFHMDRLWKVEDLARHLGIAPKTVYNRLRTAPQKLPPPLTRENGEDLRWRLSDVDRWLEERSPYRNLPKAPSEQSLRALRRSSNLQKELEGFDFFKTRGRALPSILRQPKPNPYPTLEAVASYQLKKGRITQEEYDELTG